jgi:uroporphyrinogen decarboxylase
VPPSPFLSPPPSPPPPLVHYVEQVPVDAIGLDWTVDPIFVRERIDPRMPVQGNLDPLVLRTGGAALDRMVDMILEAFSERPFIFNLGHGVLPQTPIAHIERMLARVRAQ